MMRFYDDCNRVHLRILQLLQESLGLSDSHLTSRCGDGNAEVRITHYPAVELEKLNTGGTFRIAEHTDVGTLTLLFQDSVGGLEVEHQSRPSEFLPVLTSSKSEMIVNVGDTLQKWTNGKLRSANHRVMAPRHMAGLAAGVVPPRLSVAFFGKANPQVLMQPLAPFVDKGQPGKLDGGMLTAAEYYSGMQTKTFPEAAVRNA